MNGTHLYARHRSRGRWYHLICRCRFRAWHNGNTNVAALCKPAAKEKVHSGLCQKPYRPGQVSVVDAFQEHTEQPAQSRPSLLSLVQALICWYRLEFIAALHSSRRM